MNIEGEISQEVVDVTESFMRQLGEKLTPSVVLEALKSNGHFEIHFADQKFQRILLLRKDTL